MKKTVFIFLATTFFISCETHKPNPVDLTIQELSEAIKRQEITATELVKQCIASHKKNQQINAFILFLSESALEKAQQIDARIRNGQKVGKLAGIPFSVKDNIFTKGIPTTAGSYALKDFIPNYNSTVVQKLLDEDAILIGKNNMHELAFGITGLNESFGDVKNPYNTTKIAGGSSSGTAVSVSVGSSIFGIGTDTGGSVRIPSSLTNLYGFRPSIDRYDNKGLVNLSKTRDTQGIIAKKIKDVIYLDNILTSTKTILKSKDISQYRIGFPKIYYRDNLSPEVFRLVGKAVAKLKKQGFTLIEKDITNISQLNQSVSFPVVLYESKQELNKLIFQESLYKSVDNFIENIKSPDVKQTIQMVFSDVKGIPENIYQKAVTKDREKLINAFKDYFLDNKLDAIMFPLTIIEATSISDCKLGQITLNNKSVPVFPTYINNTDPGSNSNMPGITIPIGFTEDGLPLGMGLDMLAFNDAKLLELAEKIDDALSKR